MKPYNKACCEPSELGHTSLQVGRKNTCSALPNSVCRMCVEAPHKSLSERAKSDQTSEVFCTKQKDSSSVSFQSYLSLFGDVVNAKPPCFIMAIAILLQNRGERNKDTDDFEQSHGPATESSSSFNFSTASSVLKVSLQELAQYNAHYMPPQSALPTNHMYPIHQNTFYGSSSIQHFLASECTVDFRKEANSCTLKATKHAE